MHATTTISPAAVLALLLPAMTGAALRKSGLYAATVWGGVELYIALNAALGQKLFLALHEKLGDATASPNTIAVFITYATLFILVALPVGFAIAFLSDIRKAAEAPLAAVSWTALALLETLVRGALAGILINAIAAVVLLLKLYDHLHCWVYGGSTTINQRVNAAEQHARNLADLQRYGSLHDAAETYLEQSLTEPPDASVLEGELLDQEEEVWDQPIGRRNNP